ncbi:hypothetical protein ACFXQA_06090 [Microbacterium sp. P07]|uniref:hypothetical protein n=1 Tax=Microbacterium sp. P07 TaxID=3366952 RepID=UPI0037464039
MAMGAAVAVAVFVSLPLASLANTSERALPGPTAVMTIPDGLTVAGLSVADGVDGSLSIAISGCGAGESVRFAARLRFATGGGSTETPILLEPAVPIPATGVAEISLELISEWLVAQQPERGAEVVVEATCILTTGGAQFPGETVTRVIPAGIDVAEPVPTPPGSDAPSPSPSASSTPPVEDEGVAEIVPPTGEDVLAESGAEVAMLVPTVGLGMLLLLSGTAARLVRHRLAT